MWSGDAHIRQASILTMVYVICRAVAYKVIISCYYEFNVSKHTCMIVVYERVKNITFTDDITQELSRQIQTKLGTMWAPLETFGIQLG